MSFDVQVQWNDVPVTNVNGEWGAFALLGLRKQTVAELGKLFTGGQLAALGQHGFARFQELVGLREFEFMSYGYLLDELPDERGESLRQPIAADTEMITNDTEQRIIERQEHIVRALVPLVRDFMGTHDETVPLWDDSAMNIVRVTFALYEVSLTDISNRRDVRA